MYNLERIKEFIDYNEETGILKWKKSRKGAGIGFVVGDNDRCK